DFFDSNDDSTLIDDDSFSIDNIEYVEASPPDSELISSEVMEIVILKVGGIDDDILLTIIDDILREKLLNINLLIANIEALKDNPTPSGPALHDMTPGTISSGLVPKTSSSTSYVPPSRNDWDLLFQLMFDELLNPPPSVINQAPEAIAPIVEVIPPV
nr:hypothetical protein [Tanacetum cinerariifolium]